ncbi:MAG: CRISPR-associated endonuclease Cas3'' [Chloroflexi bacterium]|nr:CRISPR-associated endonuclease Cas3'' [Chloroflexota bacterium]
MQTFLARTSQTGKQLLSDHLSNVSNLSAVFSNYENISKLTGILHDLGKATSAFQNYLINGGERGKIVHAMQGVFFVDDIICDLNDSACVLVKEIVALTIAAHHNSLNDGVSPDGGAAFYQKLIQKMMKNIIIQK